MGCRSRGSPLQCTWERAAGTSPAAAIPTDGPAGPSVAGVPQDHRVEPDDRSEPAEAQRPPTLYEWAGGREALRLLIDAFYDRVERDDLLSPLFAGGVSEGHRDHVTSWWTEVFGGPAEYTPLGGYPRMLNHHIGLNITPEQRFRFASLMSLAADDAALPADPEFRSALVAYLEWGTRLAMHNSADGAQIVSEAPVPRWGWGVAPPFTPH